MNDPQRRIGPGGLLLLLPWALLTARYAFLCDDAFITFRYSRNWAEGHGPVYNLGEQPPVEGYSDFLWMALAALVHRVGLDMPTVMPVISAATGALLLLLVHRALRSYAGLGEPAATAVGLVLALSPSFAVWSTSGLETMPQALFTFAAWYLLAAAPDARRSAWLAGLAALALALVRTEGVAWAVVIAGVAAVHRRLEGRPVLPALLPFLGTTLAGYAAYFAWRYSFYESLLANTAYAKVHATPETLVRGLEYVALFLLTTLAPVALLLVAGLGLRGEARVKVASAGVMGVGVLAYAVAVSGDYMTWFRILVPALPFLVLAFGAALPSFRLAGRGGALLAALVALLGVLPAFDVHLVPREVRAALNVRDKLDRFRTENGQWEAMREHVVSWTERGQALAAYAEPGTSLVAGAIGCLGYHSNLTILDRNGLVTAEVARAPWDGRLRSPGHDKTVEPDFFLPWEPDLLDAKVLAGPKLHERVVVALREMEAERFRTSYFPELFPLEKEAGQRKRVLLVLKRAEDAAGAAQGWERFEVERTKLEGR